MRRGAILFIHDLSDETKLSCSPAAGAHSVSCTWRGGDWPFMAGQNGPCKEEQTELLAGSEVASSSNTKAVTLPVIGVLEVWRPRPLPVDAAIKIYQVVY